MHFKCARITLRLIKKVISKELTLALNKQKHDKD